MTNTDPGANRAESHELDWVVERAVEVAMQSPCQSKRGVVIWSGDSFISSGFNHQPKPFVCDGTDRCKLNCGKTAIHAEQMAILHGGASPRGASMLHVKAYYGVPCASMAPSCLQCSKLILYSGIAWMYLIHSSVAQMLPGAEVVGSTLGYGEQSYEELQIRRYSAVDFHRLTAEWSHRIELVRGGR